MLSPTFARRNLKRSRILFFHPGVLDRRLLSKGYSLDEIVAVVMETEALKKSRAESVKLNGREKLLFAMDSAGKTLRKIVGNGNKPQGPNSVQARMA